jgi:16S rRNA (cytosine967-C5)-methyltransferase
MNYQSKSSKESIPDWMDELGVKELGEKFGLQKCSSKPTCKVIFRVNTLKLLKRNESNLNGLEYRYRLFKDNQML